MMSEGHQDWKSQAFRTKVVAQIDEVIRNAGTHIPKSSIEMENHVFQKAKSRDEYMALVARLILHVKDFTNKEKQAAAAAAAAAAGMAQQGVPPPQPGPGMQQSMPDPINALQNLAMQGTAIMGGQQQQAGMLTSQQAAQLQYQRHLLQTRPQQQKPIPLQRHDAFIVTAAQQQMQNQPVQVVTSNVNMLPYQSGTNTTAGRQQQMVQSPYVSPQQYGHGQSPVQSQQVNQVPVPSPIMSSSQMGSSPATMMAAPSPQTTIVPSPVSRTTPMGAPSPGSALNTPGNPGSVGTVPSPASRNPADDQAYLEKLKQLSKYIDPLRRMINRIDKEEDKKKDQLSKMKNLLEILSDSTKRLPMQTLLKCEQVLEKLDFQKSTSSSSFSTSTTRMGEQHMCQPLLDAVAANIKSPTLNHSLQRTFGPAITALHGPTIRAPSPPSKRRKVEEKKDEVPNILQGEIARLEQRFKINLDPAHHSNSRTVHLICKLDDKNLPSVPPILITVPENYPDSSPLCNTNADDYRKSFSVTSRIESKESIFGSSS